QDAGSYLPKLGHQLDRQGEWIIQILHENAALEVDHPKRSPIRGLHHGMPLTRGASRVIRRPQQLVRVGLQPGDDLLLGPDVVAPGEQIPLAGKQRLGAFGRSARPALRVFRVGDHQIRPVLGDELGQKRADSEQAGLAYHVADEEDLHESGNCGSRYSPLKVSDSVTTISIGTSSVVTGRSLRTCSWNANPTRRLRSVPAF